VLDMAMDQPDSHPAHTEEFVLDHTEPVESSGFCIHYKLPHYVTFQSSLEAMRRVREGAPAEQANREAAKDDEVEKDNEVETGEKARGGVTT
jgi:alpha-D-ribose 1-methylphosphonate 5-triphosphate synthase subunit PhnI